ncbi:hypothetical protein [Candidatus Solincola sp.]|jgi:hypothetical protein|nr:hypothetical protein [Actinomycetota bacterium]MDI7251304.1 hypothetical protein [Actinomycetota bacterium]
MVDFLQVLNDYYIRNRNKRIKREFMEVLSKDVEQLSGPQRYIYEIYIEPNLSVLQEALYEAFCQADRPLEEWRAAVLENPPSIINHVAKKTLVRAIRERETGQA